MTGNYYGVGFFLLDVNKREAIAQVKNFLTGQGSTVIPFYHYGEVVGYNFDIFGHTIRLMNVTNFIQRGGHKGTPNAHLYPAFAKQCKDAGYTYDLYKKFSDDLDKHLYCLQDVDQAFDDRTLRYVSQLLIHWFGGELSLPGAALQPVKFANVQVKMNTKSAKRWRTLEQDILLGKQRAVIC